MLNYIKNIISITRVDRKEKAADRKYRIDPGPAGKFEEVIRTLHQDGVAVIEGFYSAEQCAVLRAEIDRLLLAHPDKNDIDDAGSDHRIWGAERASEPIASFHNDADLKLIAECYTRTRMINHMTLAAKLVFREKNLGSGGGWHRDAAYEQQFKSIIYLSDVEIQNGPYEYIPCSHTLKSVIRSFRFEHNKRFSEEDIRNFTGRFNLQSKAFTAKAGTVILTDTRGIHRGMPIQSGTRYALTNYFVAAHRAASFHHIFDPLIKFPKPV